MFPSIYLQVEEVCFDSRKIGGYTQAMMMLEIGSFSEYMRVKIFLTTAMTIVQEHNCETHKCPAKFKDTKL